MAVIGQRAVERVIKQCFARSLRFPRSSSDLFSLVALNPGNYFISTLGYLRKDHRPTIINLLSYDFLSQDPWSMSFEAVISQIFMRKIFLSESLSLDAIVTHIRATRTFMHHPYLLFAFMHKCKK